MLRRTLTALALGAIALPAIIYGGWFYFLLAGVLLVGGAWEYVHLYRAAQFEPNEIVTIGGVLGIATARFFFGEAAIPFFVFSVLLAMTVHLIAFERGRAQAGLDFTVTVTGIVYLGWLGSYLLDLRQLPQGNWWLMIVLPCVWGSDTGAYSIGAAYGKHKMTPRLSPKKVGKDTLPGYSPRSSLERFLPMRFQHWVISPSAECSVLFKELCWA